MKKSVKGKTPSLIGASNGRPTKIMVKRKCLCVRCGIDIYAGAECFIIPKLGGGFNNPKRYCVACYSNVLEQTKIDLEELKNLL